MKFAGIRKVFLTENEEQYKTIGVFWDEMSARHGREKLMSLGCSWTEKSIEYVIALNEGLIPEADYEIDLPDKWIAIKGRTEDLSTIYDEIYKEGNLLYEIEEFDDDGNCVIRYCR